MAKPEYREGVKVRKKFERTMTALFRVSKTAVPHQELPALDAEARFAAES